MQITQQTDYALRVLMYIEINSNRLVNISEMAEKFNISLSHLTKVVAKLTKHNYIVGKRGKSGGLYATRLADTINLGEIFRAFEPLELIECHTCDNQCLISPNCFLNSIFGKATQAFIDILDDYTLRDLTMNLQLQQQLKVNIEI